jgi:large subunit ribosomal protein L2
MGKKLRVQRRGRGTSTFRAAKKGKVAPVQYPAESAERLTGVVTRFIHESGRSAPLAQIRLSSEASYVAVAPEGIHMGQDISVGPGSPINVGNVLPLGAIPEGTMVNNIELRPGDGGRIARSSGTFATVVSHTAEKTMLKMPSKKSVELPSDCRATIGIVAGGGRTEKPFIKAGEKHLLMRAKGRVYPQSKGISMTAASHPYGGGRHRHVGKATTVARTTPPGRKVGLIAARSTGWKKKRVRRE